MCLDKHNSIYSNPLSSSSFSMFGFLGKVLTVLAAIKEALRSSCEGIIVCFIIYP